MERLKKMKEYNNTDKILLQYEMLLNGKSSQYIPVSRIIGKVNDSKITIKGKL